MLNLFTLVYALSVTVNGMAFPFIEKRNDPTPVMLEFSVDRNIDLDVNLHRDSKREIYAQEFDTIYRGILYRLHIDLGSNRQSSYVAIDTGSSDLWVSDSHYKASDSLTSRDIKEVFEITYGDGTNKKGKMVTDEFRFKNWKEKALKDFQFAVIPRGDMPQASGILGIGDRNNEANGRNYDNLPWAMVKSGMISKASYSLFLDPEKDKGTLIFGGIDTKKYAGKLEKYPLDTRRGPGLKVNLAHISIDTEGQPNIPIGLPVFLDSGSGFNIVPKQVLDYLSKALKSTVLEANGKKNYKVDCNQPTDKYIKFDFGKNTIALSFADAIIKVPDGCYLGFMEAQEHIALGDVFLRKAYVYFDLTDRAISLGQASYSSESNIISSVDADSHVEVVHEYLRPSKTERWYAKLWRYLSGRDPLGRNKVELKK